MDAEGYTSGMCCITVFRSLSMPVGTSLTDHTTPEVTPMDKRPSVVLRVFLVDAAGKVAHIYS
jgi:hypothetical protein